MEYDKYNIIEKIANWGRILILAIILATITATAGYSYYITGSGSINNINIDGVFVEAGEDIYVDNYRPYISFEVYCFMRQTLTRNPYTYEPLGGIMDGWYKLTWTIKSGSSLYLHEGWNNNSAFLYDMVGYYTLTAETTELVGSYVAEFPHVDGTYTLQINYGMMDGYTGGQWWITGSTITIRVDKNPPTIPTNITAVSPTMTPELSWSNSTDIGSGIGYYKIYRNGNFIGTSETTGFTDSSAIDGIHWYQVSAVDNMDHESTSTEAVLVVVDNPILIDAYLKSHYDENQLIAFLDNVSIGEFAIRASNPLNEYFLTEKRPTISFEGSVTYLQEFFKNDPIKYNIQYDIKSRTTGTMYHTNTKSEWKLDDFLDSTTYTPSEDIPDDQYELRIYIKPTYSSSVFFDKRINFTIDTESPSTPTRGGAYSGRSSASSVKSSIQSTIPEIPVTKDPSLYWDPSTDNIGIDHYNIYRDGTLVGTAPSESHIDIDPSLADGSHVYQISAVDGTGHESGLSNIIDVISDGTPPTSPSDPNAVTPTRAAALSWDASSDPIDNISGFDHYKVYRNEILVGTTTNGVFYDSGPDGTHKYEITAVDSVGNESSSVEASNIVVDATPPSKPAISNQAGAYQSADITWNIVSDNITGVSHYNIYRDGVLVTTTPGSSYSDSVSEGVYNYQISSVDNIGNESSTLDAVEIIVDTTPPEVPALANEEGAVKSAALTWAEPSDNLSGVDHYKVYRNDTVVGTSNTSDFTDNTEGVNTYKIVAVDRAGNESDLSQVKNLTVDSTPPEVPAIANKSGAVKSANITWTETTDNLTGIEHYNIYRDGTLIATSDTASYDDIISDGIYDYKVAAVDGAKNESLTAESVELIVDATPPSSTNINTEDGAVKNAAITWATANDNLSGVEHYNIYRDRTLIATSETTTFSDNLTDGEHKYQVAAVDAAGNEGTLSPMTTIIIDNIVPNTLVYITGIKGNNGWFINGSITITFEAETDTETKYETSSTQSRSGIQSIDNLYSSTINQYFPDGINSISYYSVDLAGNTEEAKTEEIKVDASAPNINKLEVKEGAIINHPLVTVDIDTNDLVSGIKNIQVMNKEGAWEVLAENNQIELPAGNGQKQLQVKVEDNAGNIIEETISLELKINPVFTEVKINGKDISSYTVFPVNITIEATLRNVYTLDIDSIVLNIDGKIINIDNGLIITPLNAEGTSFKIFYSLTEPLIPGDHIIELLAEDEFSSSVRTEVADFKITSTAQLTGKPKVAPNPFKPLSNESAAIVYNLSNHANTRIVIYDITGRSIWQRNFASGTEGGNINENHVYWNGKTDFGTTVSNGVYVYIILSGDKVLAKGQISVLD